MGRRPRLPFPMRHYFLSRAAVQFAADRAHMTVTELGESMGLCKAFWFQLANGRTPVGPRRRRAILAHPAFADISQEELWVVVEIPRNPDRITAPKAQEASA